MLIKHFSIFVLSSLVSISSSYAVTGEANSYKGKGSYLASLSFHTPDRRMGNFKGFCRNIDTGEQLVCIHRYIGPMKATGVRTDSSKKRGWVYSRTSDLKKLEKGRYQLELVKFAVAKYWTGPRYGEYDYEISTKEFGIFFDLTKEFQYLGNIVFDLNYDFAYKPFFDNARIEDDFDLSKSVLRKSAQRKAAKRARKIGGVAAVATVNINSPNNSHILARQWALASSLESEKVCLEGGRFESDYVYVNRRQNGAPLIGLKQFSCIFQSVLKQEMQKGAFTEFKQSLPIFTDKKQYKIKVELR
jgi:hypothetical protein